jgi:hypothetical protein
MEKKILIQDILLKMNYDLSKTLTENKGFINEQKTYYYDSSGYLKVLNGPYAIPQGGTPASKVYPNLKPGEYPNFNFSSPPVTTRSISSDRQQIPQSDVLGPQGSFPKSLGIDKKSIEMRGEYDSLPEPREFTKKLSKTDLEKFKVERKRILNLPPSIKLKEFNSKNQKELIKQSMVSPQGFVPTNMDNYQQELSDYTQRYQKAQNESSSALNYNLALYYPEKWKQRHDDGIDTHTILLGVAVGVFAIPLLLAAAGASATVIAAAGLGAQIVSTAADTADAIVYLEEGDLEMAGLSAIFAVLPFVPNLAKYGKSLIKNAVTKESKGLQLTKQESEVISELNKKETGEQIESAAEDMAKSKKTPEVEVAIGEGKSKIKSIWKKGGETVSKVSKSTSAQILGTLAGFYLVGQGYNKAVESYKKSKKTSLDIYNTLLKVGKIKLSWEDLKWKFGSSGSKEDNEKLGAALLDGYTDKNSDEWLYNHPEYRTQNWNQKWLPIVEKEIQQKKDIELLKSYNIAKTEEEKKLKRKEVVDTWATNHILVDKNGVKHNKDEWAEKMKSIRDQKLFD